MEKKKERNDWKRAGLLNKEEREKKRRWIVEAIVEGVENKERKEGEENKCEI